MQRIPMKSVGLTLALCVVCGGVGFWLPPGLIPAAAFAVCTGIASLFWRPYGGPLVALVATGALAWSLFAASGTTSWTAPISMSVLASLGAIWVTCCTGLLIGHWRSSDGHTSAAVSTITLGPEGHIFEINDAACALLDGQASQLVGECFNDWLEPEDLIELTDSSQQPEPKTPRLIRIAHGDDTRQVFVVARRVQQNLVLQLADAEEHQQALGAVTATALSNQSLLEASHDVLLALAEDGSIVTASEMTRGILANGDELTSRNISEFIAPPLRTAILSQIQRSFDKRSVVKLNRLQLVQPGVDEPIHLRARLVPHRMDHRNVAMLSGSVMTEERQRADAQAASVDRLTRSFQDNPMAIALVRQVDGKFIDVNERFCELFGYDRGAVIGNNETTVEIWASARQRWKVLEQLKKDKQCVGLELPLKRADGEKVEVALTLRFTQHDQERCVIAFVDPIDDQLKVRRALQDAETKFEHVLRHSNDSLLIVRKQDGVIHQVNDALRGMSGYSEDELLNQPVADLSLLQDNDGTPSNLLQLREDVKELRLITKTDTSIPVLASIKEVSLGNEPFVFCTLQDVRATRDAQNQLESSEERFKSAFDNAPLAILLVDLQGKIIQSNRFAQELLVYEQEELEDLHISRLVPQEDRMHLKESLLRLAQGEETIYRSERRMLCHNGLELWTNFQIVLQRERGGDGRYFLIQAADVTDIKHSQRRMERMAFYDTLTDLANRRLFQDRLGQAIDHCQRHKSTAALLYLDLDQFKRVNDTLGHEAGDSLLRQVANRISDCVRSEDTVGRPGGDEFTVLLFDVSSPGDAGSVAEKILERLRQPISVSGHELVVTTSIGITVIPNDGQDPNVLMKNADLAMYRAKERGRNNYQFFREEMNTNAVNRLRTENELRAAVQNDEFVLHFQPKVDIKGQRMVGVESLIRWNHPDRGLVSPGEFIDVAEETGAIVDIGAWIIRESCRAGKILCEHSGDGFITALNISPRQFRDPNLVNFIRRCLRESDLLPHNLEIEITETMLMHDVEAASETVQKLHELGVRLAIDDFGTGYSSLNYLKKFPINTVKVDRSFVMDIPENQDDMAITAAVIAMAHRLNMKVVAEGVETREQLKFLRDQHCEYAQGYLFSKPQSLERILQILERRRARAGAKPPPIQAAPAPVEEEEVLEDALEAVAESESDNS